MIDWTIRNRKWLFSGIGVFFLTGILGLLKILFESTNPPMQARPETFDNSQEVAADGTMRPKPTGASGGDVTLTVPLDDYTKLFDEYLRYFVSSLNPNSAEQAIDDDIVKRIVKNSFSVTNTGEIHLSVPPWNYAALFRDQLGFFQFREAVPPPDGREHWRSYSDEDNPIDERYYRIGGLIRTNLRAYFADPSRLKSFYRTKKHAIKGVIRENVPLALRPTFTSEVSRVIESFKFILIPKNRNMFEKHLEAERQYVFRRYGNVPEDDVVIYFQGTYNPSSEPIHSIYPTPGKEDRMQERPVDSDKEETLNAARKALFSKCPNVKAAAFGYRRYLEGGDKLVEGYISILEDLRASAFE